MLILTHRGFKEKYKNIIYHSIIFMYNLTKDADYRLQSKQMVKKAKISMLLGYKIEQLYRTPFKVGSS